MNSGQNVSQVASGTAPSFRNQELSERFGELLAPEIVDQLERCVVPRSLQTLNDETAGWLRALIEATESGLGVTRYVYCELPILWIVDEDGLIKFAVEEIVEIESLEYVLPRLRKGEVPTAHARLGHPALLNAGPGRIGGEIIFDSGDDEGRWFLTNASGRYGLRAGRDERHLTNASTEFERFGIKLNPFFIPPRRQVQS